MKKKYVLYSLLVIILGFISLFSIRVFNKYTKTSGSNQIGKDDPLNIRNSNNRSKKSNNNTKGKDYENKTTGVKLSGITAKSVKYQDKFPYYIILNRKRNTVTIYNSTDKMTYNNPFKVFICSTGLNKDDTPIGNFHTKAKYKWRALFGNVYGQYATRISDNILFHSVPYEKQKKNSLKMEEYNKLGYKASMGCVRMNVAGVKWIYDNCPIGTGVTIYDGDAPGELGKPKIKKITKTNKKGTWDPTDPDEENPWNND